MVEKILRTIHIKCMNRQKYISFLREDLGIAIGKGCEIYKDVDFGSEPYLISIGNNVRVSSQSKLITHDGGMWVLRKMGISPDADKYGQIVIGDNTHIGVGVTVMGGVTIGKNCIVGCGAVVTKNIPDNSVAVGVPARVIETIEEYYEKNKDKIVNTKHLSASEKRDFLIKEYKL